MARVHMHECNWGPCRCGSDAAATCETNEPPGKARHTEPNAVPEKMVAQAAVHLGAAHPWVTCHARTLGKKSPERAKPNQREPL